MNSVQDEGSIVALALDSVHGFVFWANNAVKWKGIYRARLNGSDIMKIVSEG